MQTQIQITRAEGFAQECVTCTFSGPSAWEKADAELNRWARTAPDDGSYHKCDFSVLFEDGSRYDGRYDLVHRSIEKPSLAASIRSHLRLWSGARHAKYAELASNHRDFWTGHHIPRS